MTASGAGLGGTADVLRTPTSMMVAGGLTLADLIQDARAGAGHEFKMGGDLNAEGSFNGVEIHKNWTTDTESPLLYQPYDVRPEIVTPEGY